MPGSSRKRPKAKKNMISSSGRLRNVSTKRPPSLLIIGLPASRATPTSSPKSDERAMAKTTTEMVLPAPFSMPSHRASLASISSIEKMELRSGLP